MSKRNALLGLVSACVLGLALFAPASSAERSHDLHASARPGMGAAHWFGRGKYGWWGKVPYRRARRRSFLAVDQLKNPGNGEIMPTTNTHLIFWLPAGFHYNDAGGDTAYEDAMQTYFRDVGGSQILNTTTQYPGNNGTPSDTSTYVDSVVDTTAFPHTGADAAHAVTQGDLNQEVFNQIGANSWPTGMSDMYFVFLPDNLVDCDNGWDQLQHERVLRLPHARLDRLRHAGQRLHLGGHPGQPRRLHERRLRQLDRDGRQPGRHDAQLRRARAAGGDHRSQGERLAGLDRRSAARTATSATATWASPTRSTTANNFLGGGAADLFRIQREWSNAAAVGPAANGCAASYTTTGSHVESPSPTGGDVTASVTEATIPGNNGDALHYHVSFHDPSNQDDAFSISDSASYATGVAGPGSTSLGESRPAPDRGRQPDGVRDRRPAAGRDGADVDVHDELRRLDRNRAADDRADGDARPS